MFKNKTYRLVCGTLHLIHLVIKLVNAIIELCSTAFNYHKLTKYGFPSVMGKSL